MPLVVLPLADFLEAIGPLLVVLFWVLKQVFSSDEEALEDPEQPARRVRIGEDGEIIEEDVEPGEPKSIDDFLEEIRAAEEKPAVAKQMADEAEVVAAPVSVPAGPIDPFEEPPRQKPKPRKQPKRQKSAESPKPRPVVKNEKPRIGSKPGNQNTSDKRFAERTSHLGETIAQADDRIDARLHKKFDHQLGNLDKPIDSASNMGDRTSRSPITLSAQNLREMLSSPSGMRDAIILNEILQRPANRWED